MREVRRDRRNAVVAIPAGVLMSVEVDIDGTPWRASPTHAGFAATDGNREVPLKFSKAVGNEAMFVLGPASMRYMNAIEAEQRDESLAGAAIVAGVTGHPQNEATALRQIWSHHIALVRGEDPVKTRSSFATWDAQTRPEITQLRGRVHLSNSAEPSTRWDFMFVSSIEDAYDYLERHLGTPDFHVHRGEISLRLPRMSPLGYAQPSDEGFLVTFTRPPEWTVEEIPGDLSHAIPHGSARTLCGVQRVPERAGAVVDDTREVTCPWCRVQLIAAEIASPAGPRSPQQLSRPSRNVTLHEEIARILELASEEWLSTDEIAARVNHAERYQKRDHSVITPFQVHGRTRKYPALFERDGAQVRLRRDAEEQI
jgi:hypothetical protein